jgi:pilus assembly protein Flp/PilA
MKGVFTMLKKIKGLFKEEEGQGMTEYGLILALIALAVIGALVLFREQITALFNKVKDAMSTAS